MDLSPHLQRGKRKLQATGTVARVTLGIILAAVLLVCLPPEPVNADVVAVRGSAYGYFASISLFGGPPGLRGPLPTVTLPSSGSASPITATVPTGSAQYSSFIQFSSGPIVVSTQGTVGPAGSVTSSATVSTVSVNVSGQEVFTAASVFRTCTATQAGVSDATTITAF